MLKIKNTILKMTKASVVKSFAIASLTALTACASLDDPQETNASSLSVTNVKHIDTVVRSWGAPQNIQKLTDGSSLYQWNFTQNSKSYLSPSYYPGTGVSAFSHWPSSASRLYPGWWSSHGQGFYPGPYSLIVNRPFEVETSCNINLTADKTGMIIDRQYSGDACNI